MEVQKRVQLKTVDKPKEVETKPVKLAVRFEIKLEESTDDKCPEISYADLLLKHELRRKRMSSSSNLSNHNVFGPENEENLETLAKQMEEKYGKSYGGLSRGRHIDLGDGYDTEDSFIDNEEAYDELVPSSLTTKHGGFYINTGVLDFKEVSDDEIVSDNELKTKKKKKRVISSDSEEESERKQNIKPKRKRKTLSVSTAENKNKKSLLAKKRKKMLTGDKLDKERMKKKIMLKKKLVERSQLTLSEKELHCKAKQYDSLIDDVINSQANLEGNIKSAAASTEPASTSTEPSKAKEPKGEPVKLPDNLSNKCLQFIESLKQAAAKCVDEKSKFFTNDINSQLTSLDVEVRKISSLAIRNSVYSHLSSFLPINRETLMKRMKMLRQKELMSKLHQPIEDLKSVINEVMPAQIERFNQESLARQASKLEDAERQKEDTQDSEDDASPSQAAAVSGSTQPSTANPSDSAATQEEKKKEKAPAACRKKFEWTEKVREKLYAVITIKMESYEILKTKGQSPDDHLKEFLEIDIRTLWPKGWMQSRVLYRESKSAHVKWTNPSTQPVTSKPPVVAKKPALITNAMKMAANISTNTKKSAHPVKSNTNNNKDTTKSSVRPTSTTGTEAKEAKTPIIVPVVSTAMRSLVKPITTQGSATTVGQSLSVSKSADSLKSQDKISKPNLLGTTVRTTDSGQKIVMDGTRVIGRLVPAVDKKSTATIWDKPSTTTKSDSTDVKPFNPTSISTKASTSASFSKTVSPAAISTKPAASVSNVSKGPTSADDIKLITLPDSSTSSNSSSLMLPASSSELSLGTAASRQQNISAAQTEQAAAAHALQRAHALQQKHLAASLAGQQAMLQHKKLADSLATQQNVAKQKHIAAIAAEQKANAHLVTQQRIAQQAYANQQKRVQMQQQQQKTNQEQQRIAQAQKLKLSIAQQQNIQQHKIVQQVGQQQKMVQAHQNNMAQVHQAQQQKLVQTQQAHGQQRLVNQKLAHDQLVQQKQKLAEAQQQKLVQIQVAQQRAQLQQARQQLPQSCIVTSPRQPIQFTARSSSSIPTPHRVTSGANSTPRGATPTLVASPNSRVPAATYSFPIRGSSPQSPVSSSSSANPSWPLTGLQQQQLQQQAHMAEYRRYLAKMDEK